MKQKSQKILKLLTDENQLTEERSKALKISKEIQGFGNLIISPSASTPSSSSSRTSRTSFSSYSCDSPSWSRQDELNKQERHMKSPNKASEESTQHGSPKVLGKGVEKSHLWDNPIEENGYLIGQTKEEETKGNSSSQSSSSKGYYTGFLRNSYQSAKEKAAALRSLSDIGKGIKKKIDRQLSLGF